MFTKENLEITLKHLQEKKGKWANLSAENKIYYLQSAMKNCASQAKFWAEACAMAKGIDLNSDLAGQEWLSGPYLVMRGLKLLIQTLENNYKFDLKNIKKVKNRSIAKVLPANFYESVMWKGFSAEVWIEKNKPASRAEFLKESPCKGSVSFILGAGNVSSIVPLDVLYKLYNENSVCLVKLNPVNDYLFDFFNRVFSELIQDGYLKFIKADNEISSWLCYHELIDDIHITGSNHTHDAIVWGNPAEEETKKRREHNTPKLTKKISSELGCVSPVIVVPGVWSDCDLRFQAKHVVSMVENNASFNCNAAKILVLCQQWPQRDLFLDYVRSEFKKCALRKAYYPGARERYNLFVKNYPQAEQFGKDENHSLPWLFIPSIHPHERQFAFNTEAFCGILGETSLDARDEIDFFHKASDFCNNKLWGTLSCSVLIHPQIEKLHKNEFENFLDELRYGSIGVNCWAALVYSMGSTTWGAYPGATLQDIQSGIGSVHNTFMFDYPEKSIVRAPFKIWPKPIWFYDKKNLKEMTQHLLKFEYTNSFVDFIKVIFASL